MSPTVAGRSGTSGDGKQDPPVWLRVAERANDNAPSADRIVCRGRAGKCRAATSVRLGWPSADGAGSRGRRDRRPGYKAGWRLDPHRLLPVEPTNLASSLSPLPVWPGAPCVCWPTRRCCHVGTPPAGVIGPNFRGTLGRCRRMLGSGDTKARAPGRTGGSCFGVGSAGRDIGTLAVGHAWCLRVQRNSSQASRHDLTNY